MIVDKIDIYARVRILINEFMNKYNERPNRIVMGYHIFDELVSQLYMYSVPVKTFEEAEMKLKCRICCEFEGIPVEIVYDNPNTLEVGYMVKWLENK